MLPSQATQIHKPLLWSVFILSCASLAYEVLLIRLFSIIHWHHFAFMVISIALLGYGVSGSLITVFQRWLLNNYDRVFIGNILLFGISSTGCFIIVQHLPFNTLEILWDSSQWQRLLFTYLLLTLPFFFVANVFALTFMRFHRNISQVYSVDLIGAGAGALLVMVLLQVFTPDTLLRVLSVFGLTAGLFALASLDIRYKRLTATMLSACMVAIIMLPQQWLDLRLSEYKGLSQTLLIKDASQLQSHSSPVSQVSVVQNRQIPFRYAPGLSLQSPAGPPEQLAVFRDGDVMTAIDHVTGTGSLEYYDYMSSALPYHVHRSPQNALILYSATGSQILQAKLHEIPLIDAVEPDQQLSQLITDEYADYYDWDSLKDKVTFHRISARGMSATGQQYDLVIIGPPGSSTGGAAGVHALSTSYDYTVEALQSYLELLSPDGLLSITMWTSTPARGSLKLFVTAVQAMKNAGISKPGDNIAWIRSWNTSTLLLKNTALTAKQISAVREFSRTRNFDLAWLPGIQSDEVNRYQRLQEPVFYLAARSLLKQATSDESDNHFIEQYKYDIQASTDNIPYFNNYFRWSSLKELFQLPGRAGISMIGVGYPTLLLTLLQASVAAFVLILLPLLFIRKGNSGSDNKAVVQRGNIFIYYFAIGLAFLFIELAFIQKFTLILSQPLYAAAIALCAFLFFSGLGALYVEHRLRNNKENDIAGILRVAIIMIALITILYIIALPQINDTIMALPETARIVSAFLLAAPLAFFMGMPFPLGLATLQRTSPDLIPWAWGINGCASVLSAILAVLLAIEAGFNGVMSGAVILYLLAWLSSRKAVNQVS